MKAQIYGFFGIVGAIGLLFFFNNCGEISFNTIDGNSSILGSQLPTDDGSGGVPPPQSEIDDVLGRIPPDDLENPRPITDLEDFPELAEIYACGDPDSTSVMICHFPNSGGANTQCVGLPSVPTHYDHVRIIDVNGDSVTLRDYLGPCR